jgi:hypothetical protein
LLIDTIASVPTAQPMFSFSQLFFYVSLIKGWAFMWAEVRISFCLPYFLSETPSD